MDNFVLLTDNEAMEVDGGGLLFGFLGAGVGAIIGGIVGGVVAVAAVVTGNGDKAMDCWEACFITGGFVGAAIGVTTPEP